MPANSRKQTRTTEDRVESVHPQSESLQEKRTEIDQIDDAIVGLLVRRLSLAEEVACVKRSLNLPIKDANREFKILNRVMRSSSNPEIAASLQQIYEKIIEISRQLQEQEENTEPPEARAV